MKSNFNLDEWNRLKPILKRRFPQLTDADLFWRHETKNDLYKMLATRLEKTQKQLEIEIEILEGLGETDVDPN
jgi:hypothetical protein